jgi:signal transduction histidine kinase
LASSEEDQLLLATRPPSKWQIRVAVGIVVALVVTFFIMAPFANTQLPHVDIFYPITLTVIVINDLIISALLFSQFFAVGRRALFVLAVGYLFTGLIIIPQILTFPEAFSSTGLLGAGLQSATYLGVFWRVGSALAVISYALLRDVDSEISVSTRSPTVLIVWSVVAVIAVVCGLTLIATMGESFLPVIYVDSVNGRRGAMIARGAFMVSLDALALALLWVRWRSVLDLWLMVMCCTWLLVGLAAILINARFTLGTYSSRMYEVIATVVILLVLLSEQTALYANLTLSVIRQRRAREAWQIGMEAMAASIAHEIKQPVASMVLNGDAGLNWLALATPDLDKARASLKNVVSDGHRVSEVIDGIRSMFKKDIRGRTWLGVNEVVREVLIMVDVQLRTQKVSVSTQLREGLPQIRADRAQLQQVFLNLIANAIEAMRSVTGRARLLRIGSDIIQESSTVLVTVEDAGTGINSKDKDHIFEPFFTTKSEGTGIGLAVCRSIIEAHGGSLKASAANPHGTIFQIALPIGDTDLTTGMEEVASIADAGRHRTRLAAETTGPCPQQQAAARADRGHLRFGPIKDTPSL